MEETPFTWFSVLPLPQHAVTATFVTLLIVAFAAYMRRRLASTEAALDPDEGVSARSLGEAFVEVVLGLGESTIGHGAERFVPLLGSFFVFILVSNLLGLIPGFTPPTSDFNVTFALGVVAFVSYHVYGVREHGFRYVRQFLGPVIILAPLMVVIEVFGHAFRPVSLGIRLFANMFADHQLLEIFTGLTKLVVPVAFYMLGSLVCVVQAFVFTMLSATYIALAVSHDH